MQLKRRDLLKLGISAVAAIALLTFSTSALPPISVPSTPLLSPVLTPPFVLQPQFDFTNEFHEGLAAVETNDKWGYIDKSGHVTIKLQFDSAVEFSEGLAAVEIAGKSG